MDDATCLGCACLCDDIRIVVEAGRIEQAERACELGRTWYRVGEELPGEAPSIGGTTASVEAAIDRAAELLASARAPLVWGLSRATIEAQRAAVGIADRIGAVVEVAGAEGPWHRAIQRLGEVSATFGEVKDRADLILYDSTDPGRHLPRLAERYADDAIGRFTPGGRASRTVIAIGDLDASSADRPAFDESIPFPRDRRVAFYATLRAVVAGLTLDDLIVNKTTGISRETFDSSARRLKGARYGVLFAPPRCRMAEAEAILLFVRELNMYTRFVVIPPMLGGANRAGAGAVLAWQAGASGEVDFADGSPRYLPGEGGIERLRRGEVDVALMVGDLDLDAIDPDMQGVDAPGVRAALDSIPRIVVRPAGRGPDLRTRTGEGDVVLPTARPGIDEGGTVARADGVMLPLRPPFSGRLPTMADVLRAIEARLKARKERVS